MDSKIINEILLNKDMTAHWPECLLVYTCEADQPGKYWNKVAKIPCDWIFDTEVGYQAWGEEIAQGSYQQEIRTLILRKTGDVVPEDHQIDILVRRAN